MRYVRSDGILPRMGWEEVGGRLSTRVDAGGAGTRREGGGTRRESGGLRPAGGFVRGLPPVLDAEFVVVGEFAASGAEADVVLVESRSSGARSVLKLYRRGIAPDESALTRLAEADPAHVVRIERTGWADDVWFEVLEYCERGSLSTIIWPEGTLDLVDVVEEIAAALDHVHRLGLVHRDLKPANVLVRSLSPFDLVLADFGLVREVDGSVRWTRGWGTPAYSPPELDSGEVSAAWDWWSLGMIVAELAAGRHPFEDADGTMLNDQQIRSWVAQRPVDLSGVTHPQLNLLCRGLLARDRHHRWGAEQVSQWLAGGTPAVVTDQPATSASRGRTRQVLFEGREYASAAELAVGFQQNWSTATRRLFQEKDQTLVEEVHRLLVSEQLDIAADLLNQPVGPAEIPRRFATLLVEMNPDLDPVYDGVDLTPVGLEAAAIALIGESGDDPTARILDQVRDSDVLIAWRGLHGMDGAAALQQAWAAAHQAATDLLHELQSHGYTPTQPDQHLTCAWTLLCQLAPEHHNHLTDALNQISTDDAAEQPWWHNLTQQPTPTHQLAALLTATTAQLQTQQRVAAADAAKQREADEQQKERHRTRLTSELSALGNRTRLRRVPGASACLGLVVVAIFVFGTIGSYLSSEAELRRTFGSPVGYGVALGAAGVAVYLVWVGLVLAQNRAARAKQARIDELSRELRAM